MSLPRSRMIAVSASGVACSGGLAALAGSGTLTVNSASRVTAAARDIVVRSVNGMAVSFGVGCRASKWRRSHWSRSGRRLAVVERLDGRHGLFGVLDHAE